MGSGDLSTDLSLGVLTPTPSVRPAQGHSPSQDAEGKARRRPRPEPENSENEASPEGGDSAPHQLDHLA
jgi:hypothetical protein